MKNSCPMTIKELGWLLAGILGGMLLLELILIGLKGFHVI